MKYDESKETIELLRKIKYQYKKGKRGVICIGINCTVCPFRGPGCNSGNVKERYEKVCERLSILERMKMKKRTEFEAGDKVTMLIHGVIKDKKGFGDYQLVMQPKNGHGLHRAFKIDGYEYQEGKRSLYHGHIEIPETAYYVEEPEEPVVLNWNDIAEKFGIDPDNMRIENGIENE